MARLISSSNVILREYNLEAGAWDEYSVVDLLKNSVAFSQRLSSDYDGFKELENILFGSIWAGKKIHKEKSKRHTLGRVLRNIYYAYVHRTALAVSMDKRTYTRNGRKKHNVDSYRDLAAIFRFLESNGIVGRQIGNKRSGKASRYWILAGSSLEERFNEWRNKGTIQFRFEDPEPLIILKDEEKKPICLDQRNPFIEREEYKLGQYNQLIKEVRIGLAITDWQHQPTLPCKEDFLWQQLGREILIMTAEGVPVYRTGLPPLYMKSISNIIETWPKCEKEDLRQILRQVERMMIPELNQLQRKFNKSSLTNGGRYYGSPVQNLPKQVRRLLTINGNTVVEHDYSCLHPSILYHREGLELPPHPYLFEDGNPLRSLVKVLLNTAINAESDQEALSSVWDSLTFEAKYKAMDAALVNSPYSCNEPGLTVGQARHRSLKALFEDVVAYHAPIRNCLNSGEGIRLQRIDSDIASEIMWHFTQHRIPVLPIHDSFIIEEQYSADLKEVMQIAYFKRFKKQIAIK